MVRTARGAEEGVHPSKKQASNKGFLEELLRSKVAPKKGFLEELLRSKVDGTMCGTIHLYAIHNDGGPPKAPHNGGWRGS